MLYSDWATDGCLMKHGLILSRTGTCVLSRGIQTGSGDYPASFFNGYMGFIPRG